MNVNGTGAKSIKKNYSASITNLTSAGELRANETYLFTYDGTYWILITSDYNSTYYYTSIYCTTAAGTAAKAAAISNEHTLEAGKYFQVWMYYANTAQSALTLNISGKGAKPIYINGQPSSATNYTLPAGCYIVHYDGTNYYFRTDNKLTANITGDAGTVNGRTVLSDVPAGAKFTDENTTYTFTGGTNKFTVTGSDGSSNDITVTPSIAASDISGIDNYKTVQTAVTSPTVPTSGTTTATSFIDTISQNTNGVITATKKSLPTASTSVAGIIKIGTDATMAAAGNHTHTISLDEDTGTSAITLTSAGKYKLTAGGNSVIFTMPTSNNYTHPNSGVTAGTYRSVTVDAQGHVTAGTNPITLAGYGITDANIASGTITLGTNTITPMTNIGLVTGESTAANNGITKTVGTTTSVAITQADLQSAIFIISDTAPDDTSVIWLKPVSE